MTGIVDVRVRQVHVRVEQVNIPGRQRVVVGVAGHGGGDEVPPALVDEAADAAEEGHGRWHGEARLGRAGLHHGQLLHLDFLWLVEGCLLVLG